MGYDKPGLFVFKVAQADSNNIALKIDTLGLFCSEIFCWNPGQRYSQWQFLRADGSQKYKVIEDQYHNGFEGIGSCDTELFIHPARDCYRVLQFCPYPYFIKTEKIGSVWNWSFDIGPVWAINGLYPLTSVENFQIDYTVKDTVTLNTKFGKLFCYNITAISKSRFGISYASYFLNNTYGIVRSLIKTIDNQSYEFELISKIQGIEGLQCNKYFLWEYNYRKNRQNNPYFNLK